MGYYYHKSAGARIETVQYNGALDLEVDLFMSGLRRTGNFGLVAPGDWIIKIDDESCYKCSNKVIIENYNPLTQEESMPAQPQAQDAFEPMRQVIDLDSYEYLNEAYPFYIQAIEHALTAGKTPTDIGKFVIENTSSRRDIGLLCEQAARHIQRKGQAA